MDCGGTCNLPAPTLRRESHGSHTPKPMPITQPWFLSLPCLYLHGWVWPGQVRCSVQSLSCVQLFATTWTAACQASLSITNSWSLLKLMSIELVRPSNHLILCSHPLLLPSIGIYVCMCVYIYFSPQFSFSYASLNLLYSLLKEAL